VEGKPWFESDDLALLASPSTASRPAGLVFEANVTGAGADAIGTFTNTTPSRGARVGGAPPGLPLYFTGPPFWVNE